MANKISIFEKNGTFEDGGYLLDAVATELRRLSTIERAAIDLIKCKGRYHAERNTKALATALGIALPLPVLVDSTRQSVDPEFPWHSVSIDVSTCDDDANHRIFANITGWVDGTILAEKTSQNFDSPFELACKRGAAK